jgi:hypothetical protein
VALLLQTFADAPAAGTDAVAGYAMAGDGNDRRFVVAGDGLPAAEDAGNEFANHVLPFGKRVLRFGKSADSTAK